MATGATLHDLLEAMYGVKTRVRQNPKTDNIGTSITKIADSNPNRLTLLVNNLSSNAIYISPDNLVSTKRGIYVAPGGGSVVMQWDRDFSLVSQQWYAISAAVDSDIYVLELLSY